MASMNGKRMAAVAALAASMSLMSGAAFASPAIAGGDTTGLVPEPISQLVETSRSTAADLLNQIDRAF